MSEEAVRRDLLSVVEAVGIALRWGGDRPAENLSGITRSKWELPEVSAALESSFKEVFARHGSDKSTNHDYHRTYPRILKRLNDRSRAIKYVVEIGIGSSTPSADAPDGFLGVPGGSLRAWSEVAPEALIHGFDISPEIDFADSRIRTDYLDSLNPVSARHAATLLIDSPDLIVDDGLHVPAAQTINFLSFFDALRVGGFYVIEDVQENLLPFFESVSLIVPGAEVATFANTRAPHSTDNCLVVYQKT